LLAVIVASAHVDCGGLPPLYSGEACPARSEASPHAHAAPRQASVFANGTILQHVPASRDGKQRRQAAALHTKSTIRFDAKADPYRIVISQASG
jgi:hypothetical protein